MVVSKTQRHVQTASLGGGVVLERPQRQNKCLRLLLPRELVIVRLGTEQLPVFLLHKTIERKVGIDSDFAFETIKGSGVWGVE